MGRETVVISNEGDPPVRDVGKREFPIVGHAYPPPRIDVPNALVVRSRHNLGRRVGTRIIANEYFEVVVTLRRKSAQALLQYVASLAGWNYYGDFRVSHFVL
jgi:hypothetical protein